jgi:hypothetical protein
VSRDDGQGHADERDHADGEGERHNNSHAGHVHGIGADARRALVDELEQARLTFHRLLDRASPADLRRASRGTRWTNEQLLFHMLFGYLIVRALRPLVKGFGRLPDGVSRAFARLLNSASHPFHVINYWGSRGGATVFRGARMGRLIDSVIASLQHHVEKESDAALARHMHFPIHWDPFFTDTMTLADVYHYATQHFDHHCEQLTLDRTS